MKRPILPKTGVVFLILYAGLGAVKGRNVCYNSLGCFSDERPWSGTVERPLPAMPWSPAMIDTRFFLLTRENPKRHQVISAYNVTSIKTSFFRSTRRTCFIIHGMADKAEDNWVPTLCREILYVDDVNCIGVDWRKGSGNIHIYIQAANNIRVVGAEVAYLLKVIQDKVNSSYAASNIHVIGHSLGAHAAGEVGTRALGIGRITGLDPARLYFENTPSYIRLDASDALFVDVIHTDTEPMFGLGIVKPVGHYDYYPNGGKHMAGCPSKFTALTNVNALIDILACNHLRAYQYYITSIRDPEGFLAYGCETYESFLSGSCFPCPKPRCPYMGYFADSSLGISHKPQTFYLNTGGDINSLSSWRYKVSVTLRGLQSIEGKIYISLLSIGRHVEEYQALSGRFYPGNSYSSFLDVGFELKIITQVAFRWSPTWFNILQHRLGAEMIHIQKGKDGSISSFCTAGTVRENSIQMLDSC